MRLVAVKIFVEKTEMGIKGCSTVSCLLIKRKPKEEERIKKINIIKSGEPIRDRPKVSVVKLNAINTPPK